MTPLTKAVEGYLAANRARFHMPGHKGLPLPGFGNLARWDITEVEGCDSLYEASGPIAETERRFSALYGSAASFLSAGGSTLCIQAMLALAVPPGGTVIAARGTHTAAVNAMALLDLHPVWVYPGEAGANGLMCKTDPQQVADALAAHPEASAVYVTSPNYYGVLADIPALAALCREHGVPLLVDNAHGAHLKFLEQSLHPMDLGADLCADSLHKTLPVLTGGAVLHVKNPLYTAEAKARMALFGSTSPSYPILLSIDGVLPYLEGEAPKDLNRVCGKIGELSALADSLGYALPKGPLDPLRLTLGFGEMGYTAEEYGKYIRGMGVEPEYLGERFCVFLASPWTGEADFDRLEKAITGLVPKAPLPSAVPLFPHLEQAVPLRRAVFSTTTAVPVENSAGRVAGSMVAPCPPGIPLVMPGERISTEMAVLLKDYGISRVNVIQ